MCYRTVIVLPYKLIVLAITRQRSKCHYRVFITALQNRIVNTRYSLLETRYSDQIVLPMQKIAVAFPCLF